MTSDISASSYDKTKINSFTNKTDQLELLSEYGNIIKYFNKYSSDELLKFNRYNFINKIQFISRYSDIFPIKNAVDLEEINDNHYIYNASIMNFNSGNTYFASQCPIYNYYDTSNTNIKNGIF